MKGGAPRLWRASGAVRSSNTILHQPYHFMGFTILVLRIPRLNFHWSIRGGREKRFVSASTGRIVGLCGTTTRVYLELPSKSMTAPNDNRS